MATDLSDQGWGGRSPQFPPDTITTICPDSLNFAGKWGAEEARAAGALEGSGEESSEEAWQPDWGLSLFSALNPHVITTGAQFLRNR